MLLVWVAPFCGTLRAAEPTPAGPAPSQYDLTLRPLTQIAPGTEIDVEAPRGWSHLIINSRPEIEPADAKDLSGIVRRLATLFSTNIVARVRRSEARDPAHFFLEDLGVGLATRIGQREVVVTSQTHEQLGANLGIVAGIVLGQAENRLPAIVQIVRSRTFALVDAPGIMLRDGRHDSVLLRYGVLVDHRSGRLETLLWLLDVDGDQLAMQKPYLHWLAPNLQETCLLNVDPNEFTAGIPSANAFAIIAWPPGLALPLEESLREHCSRKTFDSQQAWNLELTLRGLLAAAIRTKETPARPVARGN